MKSCKGCKHYKKDERTRLIICEFDLHESYCEKDKEDFAIKKLEKIKDEIQDYEIMSVNGNSPENVFYIARDLFIKVIDNHISELKGENNE